MSRSKVNFPGALSVLGGKGGKERELGGGKGGGRGVVLGCGHDDNYWDTA
jgi:hypothetical protein